MWTRTNSDRPSGAVARMNLQHGGRAFVGPRLQQQMGSVDLGQLGAGQSS